MILILVRQRLSGNTWTFTSAHDAIHYVYGHGKLGYEIIITPGNRLFKPASSDFEAMIAELEKFIQTSDPRQVDPL